LIVKPRPLSITIISWLFIVFGAIALVAGLWPLVHMNGAQLIADSEKHWMVHLSRIAQIVAGVGMLYEHNWARWLLVVWLAFHIIVGALHSSIQMLTHVLFFLVGMFFLFRPAASAYFRAPRAQPM
jgi:uncharacterized membrane protein HdeD (DUF308 family)